MKQQQRKDKKRKKRNLIELAEKRGQKNKPVLRNPPQKGGLPVIQLFTQVVDAMEWYILYDYTNKCILDKWLMESMFSLHIMKQDLAVMGIDL